MWPPSSGKSSYVQSIRQRGNIVWDYDNIGQSLTGCHKTPSLAFYPLMAQLQEVLIGWLTTHPSPVLWVVTRIRSATDIARRLGGQVQYMNTPPDVCIDRINREHNKLESKERIGVVSEWFETFHTMDKTKLTIINQADFEPPERPKQDYVLI